jgi:beta-barrel assembly-enhancing protease
MADPRFASSLEEEFYRRNHRRVRIFLAVLVGLVLLHDPLIRLLSHMIPVSWEVRLAKRLDMADEDIVNDPIVASTLQEIQRRLLAADPRQPFPIHIDLVRSRKINAYALPGGHIVVYSALGDFTESPEEFAGVLAHEIQHVENRHALQHLLHDYGLVFLFQALTGNPTMWTQLVEHFAGLKFSRSEEAEADRKGMRMLSKAHIKPDAMIQFFELTEKQSKTDKDLKILDPLDEMLSNHPADEKRIEALHVFLKTLPQEPYPPLAIEWSSFKRRCHEITQKAPELKDS